MTLANRLNPRAQRIVTAAVNPVVSAADLRTHLIATATELPDADALELIGIAEQFIENQINIALISQTWEVVFDRWPAHPEEWWDGVRETSKHALYHIDRAAVVEIPRWPLQSITTIKTYSEDSTETSLTVADTFDIDTYSNPGRIGLKSGATWPVALRPTNAIVIQYVAGYGDDATDVPAVLARAVKLLAARMYADRGDGCTVEDAATASGAGALLSSYGIKRI